MRGIRYFDAQIQTVPNWLIMHRHRLAEISRYVGIFPVWAPLVHEAGKHPVERRFRRPVKDVR